MENEKQYKRNQQTKQKSGEKYGKRSIESERVWVDAMQLDTLNIYDSNNFNFTNFRTSENNRFPKNAVIQIVKKKIEIFGEPFRYQEYGFN